MSEYYAVQRSGDELQHYGVKGMKWGVKKALASGSDKKMARAYKKASKKLKKLQDKADVNIQKAKSQVQAKKAIRSGVATAGLGGATGLGANAIARHIKEGGITPTSKYTHHKMVNGKMTKAGEFGPKGYSLNTHQAKLDALATGGLALATAAGAAKTAYHTGKAIAAKHRTSAKGHAKAVAKANAWKKEMDKAFAGTKYGKKSGNAKRKNRKRRVMA